MPLLFHPFEIFSLSEFGFVFFFFYFGFGLFLVFLLLYWLLLGEFVFETGILEEADGKK